MSSKPEREAKLQRARILGRIAYKALRFAEIEAVLSYNGEEKQLRTFEEDGLIAEIEMPFRPGASSFEFSRIQIRSRGRKVFEIRWDSADYFQIVLFERGGWERTLLDWPEPIPL
jgi:hypothetical protein